MVFPEVKSFTIQKFIKNTGEKFVEIKFYLEDNPFNESSIIGNVLLAPQELRGFATLLMKFANENKDFFGDTKPLKDLGKISSPDEFPSK